jgi:hypothetical protein
LPLVQLPLRHPLTWKALPIAIATPRRILVPYARRVCPDIPLPPIDTTNTLVPIPLTRSPSSCFHLLLLPPNRHRKKKRKRKRRMHFYRKYFCPPVPPQILQAPLAFALLPDINLNWSSGSFNRSSGSFNARDPPD